MMSGKVQNAENYGDNRGVVGIDYGVSVHYLENYGDNRQCFAELYVLFFLNK